MEDKLLDINFPNYSIQVGVFSTKSNRQEKIDIGITNADLMFIHENGSPLNNIPARPVLDLTIEWANKSGLLNRTIEKLLKIYIESKNLDLMDQEMNKLALKIQNYARRLIYDKDPRLVENAPSTISRKGSDTPLLDTGQLARSITCRAIRIKEENKI